jgi:hypothetical protein
VDRGARASVSLGSGACGSRRLGGALTPAPGRQSPKALRVLTPLAGAFPAERRLRTDPGWEPVNRDRVFPGKGGRRRKE